MSGFFTKVDNGVGKFNDWCRKHKVWRIVIYCFVFFLFWPVIAGFYLARFAKHKLNKSSGNWVAAVFIGLGLFLNLGWIAAASNNSQASNRQVVSQQTPTTEQPKVKEQKQTNLYRVVSVTDGDTIEAEIDGKVETIRLIGVDSPESVDPRTAVQCFGQEASDYAKSLLVGKSVKLETDGSQGERDEHSRLLRYATLEDGTSINKRMIADGYAYEHTDNVTYKYQSEFKAAQQDASAKGKGLWSASTCAGQRTKPQPVAAPAPAPVQSQSAANCDIKGNINSKDEKIYHVPGGRDYNKTKIDTSKGERYFCSEAEAQAAGWRASKV